MLAPNCHIVNPSALDAAEREYRNTIAQQGWCNLWSPLDENGLGVPPPKKNWMGVMNDKKGKDLDDQNADGDLDGDGVRKSIFPAFLYSPTFLSGLRCGSSETIPLSER